MDHVVISAENYINDQMDAMEGACFECAAVNGLTVDQAETCEEMNDGYGKFRCCGCPFV